MATSNREEEEEEICETKLNLGLGYNHHDEDNTNISSSPLSRIIIETSLTLGRRPSDDCGGALARQSSTHDSTVSSLSNGSGPLKRQRSEEEQEEEEEQDNKIEKVSTTTLNNNYSGDGDELQVGVRKKLRLTKEQSALLEDKFKEHSALNTKQKQAMAKQLNLRPRQVEVWFQNRRARTKLKQTEVNLEILKKYCETLTEQNRRLKKELQELRALKFAHMQNSIPAAAAITVCPSCERIARAGGDNKEGRTFTVASANKHNYNLLHQDHLL